MALAGSSVRAAYHQPSGDLGDTDDYWLFPTASNNFPTIATANATGDISNPGTTVANYSQGADWNGQDGNVTTVGSAGAGSESFYGTSDQGGNVWEWNETLATAALRVLRGGSWFTVGNTLRSLSKLTIDPTREFSDVGFRVASPPSLSTLLLLLNEKVQALLDEGVLNGGQANSLMRQLDGIESAIDKDKLNVACNTLYDFIDHVLGLVDDGVLTEEQALSLIDDAVLIGDLLECP